MANFTKKAIRESFLKLLSERPYHEISVRSVVEDCGINRNSFYYHYADLPALLDEILMEHFDSVIRQYPSIDSIGDGFQAIWQSIAENRKLILHLSNSPNRDLFEHHLMRFCDHLTRTYLDAAFAEQKLSDSDRELVIRILKCQLFGVYIDWIQSGMPDTASDRVMRFLEISKGLSEEVIRRCTQIGDRPS